MSQAAILSVGRLYCDLIFSGVPRLPSLGTEVFANDFSVHAGGGAFITAAHLSALGHQVSLASMLPVGPFADVIRPEMTAAEIDYSLCEALPPSGGPQLTVAMAQDGDRAFLSRKSGPAIPALTSAGLKQGGFRHLHIGELTSAVDNVDLIQEARALGLSVSVDCGWDDGLRRADILPLTGLIDIFLPNEAEQQHLKDIGITVPLAPITVVKQGSDGATATTATGAISAGATLLRAVDTTGAGDAFNAGFLSTWLEGATLHTCLEAGNRRGAMAIRQRGGYCAEDAPHQGAAAAGG